MIVVYPKSPLDELVKLRYIPTSMNEHTNEPDTHITKLMAQIIEVASKPAPDLAAIQRLSRKALEIKELKEQDAAIQKRIASLVTEEPTSAPVMANEHSNGVIRKLPIEVTEGDIRQNLLKLTPHINRGKIKVGEELLIEAYPSGERFKTVVSDKGNKLRARGEVAQFYRDAKVQPSDHVVLTEETPGRWTLKKAPPGEYSRYA